jgi:hypothetical protein
MAAPYATVWRIVAMADIRTVHTREIAAPHSEVGALLDSLGSSSDRLWPSDLWPTTVFELDRPLAVGAQGGHGSIRYGVEEYAPGRLVLFRFTPGSGLEGVHGFTVEPQGADCTLLTHFAEARTTGWRRALTRPLVSWHNTMVETVLDRAEREATGAPVSPTRWPRWLRAVNAAEVGLARRLGQRGRLFRLSAVLVPSVLLAIAALHAVWASGSPWPADDFEALAERVISSGEMPPDWATWTVAGVLAVAAASVAAVAAGRRERLLRAATWTTAGVLVARGALFVPVDLLGGLSSEVERFDLALYSPLCLALGIGAAIVARSHESAGSRVVGV